MFEVVETPVRSVEEEERIRDETDRPILRAALAANIDILITGDNDFLQSGMKKPKIITAAEFLHCI